MIGLWIGLEIDHEVFQDNIARAVLQQASKR
jgi:hypothetical protein